MERNRRYSRFFFRLPSLINKLQDNGLIQTVPEGHHISHNEVFEEDEGDLRPLSGKRKQLSTSSSWIPASKKSVKDPLITKSDSGNSNQGFEVLSEEDINLVEEEIQQEGTDALAWYHPFHWEPKFYWGIYIKDEGIIYLLQKVFGKLKFIKPEILKKLSYQLLLFHEFFHFVTEMAAVILEIGSDFKIAYFKRYQWNVYLNRDSSRENEPIEEAIANAIAYNRLIDKVNGFITEDQLREFRETLKEFMKSQPNGYKKFGRYLKVKETLPELVSCLYFGDKYLDFREEEKQVFPLEMIFDWRSTGFFTLNDIPIYLYLVKQRKREPIKDYLFKENIITDRGGISLIEQKLIEQSIHAEKIKYYKKAVEIDPQDKDAWYYMGVVYHDLGNNQKAIECCERAVEIDPQDVGVWFDMGNYYYELGNREKAIECYENVLRTNPTHEEALEILHKLKESEV